MAKVTLEHLTKHFGPVVAVDDLSFEVPDGAFLAMLGPSGCGKTTAMRCIAGLEQPTSGTIAIDGRAITHVPPQQRDIAMVFQNYALYPHFSVYQNIAYPLRKRRLNQPEIDARVRRTARFLQIEHLLDRKPKALSGGEQQRVALGRAIVREPRLFLMDEPLSNLDAKLRLYMRAELKGLQKDLGITTIFVTHDQAEAMTMADAIAVMYHGQLQQLGSPLEVYQRPANLFVAGFVGSPPMNTLTGTLRGQDGKCWLAGDQFQLDLTAWARRHVLPAAGAQLTLGVRPEHLRLRPATAADTLIGEVYVAEPLGSEVIVNLKVGPTMLKARTDPAFVPARGERFAIDFDMQQLHGFDAKTGQRMTERTYG